MTVILSALLSWLSSKWGVWSWFIAAAVVVYTNFLGAVNACHTLIAQLDAITRPSLGATGLSVSPFSFVNYFVPLDLAITLSVAWFAFYAACNTVRVVKAWIPTIG